MHDLKSVFTTIIMQGLRGDSTNKRGNVFLVRKKEHFTSNGVIGFVCGSQAAIQLNSNSSTHWTPNLYCYGTYTDNSKKYIKGHEERNLRQINTFVVDVDSKDYSYGELVLHSVDAGLGEPTLIIESDKGFHVYFTLNKPIYISATTEFKSLKIAKRIANNLKDCFSSVGADINCNDFGFFRIPNNSNIVHFNKDAINSMSFFMNWSMQYDDSCNRTFKVLNGNKTSSVSNTVWIRELLGQKEIKGSQGQYGRNSIMFTLSLSCMQDGKSIEECFDVIDQFNSQLEFPISIKDVSRVINSAYSGKYNGANHSRIADFYETYLEVEYKKPIASYGTWYKFKKERKDRVRSHYDEWELDINDYLYNATVYTNARYVELSQQSLCDAVGISRSTLNELVKQSSTLVKKTIGKGRFAVTQWSTVAILIDHCIRNKSVLATAYNEYVNNVIDELLIGLEDNEGGKVAMKTLLKIPLIEDSVTDFSLII